MWVALGDAVMKPLMFALFAVAAATSTATAQEPPPVASFARAPAIEHATISPDGARIAYVTEEDGQPLLVVINADTSVVETVISSGETKARDVRWAANDVVLFVVSETGGAYSFRGDYEFSAAFAIDLGSSNVRPRQVLRPGGDIDSQTNYAGIVGIDWANERILLQAYSDDALNLFAVNPRGGRPRRQERGMPSTRDWVTNANGDAVARLDYSSDHNRLSIRVADGGIWRSAVQARVEVPTFSLGGLGPDGESVAALTHAGPSWARGLYLLNTETGDADVALFAPDDIDVRSAIVDPYLNRIIGARYDEETPRTEWFDGDMATLQAELDFASAGAIVEIRSWSRDRNRILMRMHDESAPPTWFMVDIAAETARPMSSEYPELAGAVLAQRAPFSYIARDGVEIPGYLTTPASAGEATPPLVVLPHGGPESRDRGGFDAWAHFFASRGYAVLQPNFRGSSGYGGAFTRAGYGGWGRGVMQHDVTDGVRALIEQGRVDPDRICIVGASYGGYAALAGAAFTPELYACAAAIAPITDLPDFLGWVRNRHGRRHWIYEYFEEITGGDVGGRTQLQALSPARHATSITAPVLLIHGRDDTVVPIDQSRTMERALRRAGGDVEFIELSGEDHWLSRTETRLQTMQALDAFLAEHLQ